MRLLLLEDNRRLVELLRSSLDRAGFMVDAFGGITEGAAALERMAYSVVVLDLGLPDGDGMELLRRARSRDKTTPILIISVRDSLDDRVEGLNAGADDYLVKPFAMEELVARLRALLRRPGGVLGERLVVGNLSFDAASRMVTVDGLPLLLPRRELGLLELLVRRAGQVVPKDVIGESSYGAAEDVSPNTIEVAIHRLRRRLAEARASVSVTALRGVGYILMKRPD